MPMPFSLKLVGIDETQRKFYIEGLDRFITLDYNEETLKIRVLNEDNKEIASFELQNEDEDSYLLYAMGDLPSEFQRKGIGTAAIQMFKDFGKKNIFPQSKQKCELEDDSASYLSEEGASFVNKLCERGILSLGKDRTEF